jgi:hypothetical protein
MGRDPYTEADRPDTNMPTPMAESPPTLQSPLHRVLRAAKDAIEAEGGSWTSSLVREEDPPSAAAHCLLGGKRYFVIFHPTDLPDRAGR